MQVEVGQEVAVVGRTQKSVGWHVVRVTPSGQIVVKKGETERRFNAKGNAVGDYWTCLSTDVEKVKTEIRAARAKSAAVIAMNQIEDAVQKHRFGDLDKMEAGLVLVAEQLALARAALENARAAHAALAAVAP